MKTICFIIPYFGRIPDYFRLFLLSASTNNTIDFYFLTDQNIESPYDNVKIISTSFQNIQEKVRHFLGQDIVLDEPYKLTDYKPTYGFVFQDIVHNYDFWGYCDVDLILGDLRKWLTEERLSNFDKLYYSGHMTLYRNSKELNTLFLKTQKGYSDYLIAFYTRYPCHFDEGSIVAYSDRFGIPTYKNSNDFSDVSPYFYSFVWGGKSNAGFLWKDGTLYKATKSSLGIIEYEPTLYCHLQKRKMEDRTVNPQHGFSFVPNEFFDLDEKYLSLKLDEHDEKAIKKYNRNWKWRSLCGKVKRISQGAIQARIRMYLRK